MAEPGDIFTDPISETETEKREVKDVADEKVDTSSLPETGEKSKRALRPHKTQVFGESEPTDRIKQLQKLLADAKKLRTAKTPSGYQWVMFFLGGGLGSSDPLGRCPLLTFSMPSRDCQSQGKLSNPSLDRHRQLHCRRSR